jgi:hypothetical protein
LKDSVGVPLVRSESCGVLRDEIELVWSSGRGAVVAAIEAQAARIDELDAQNGTLVPRVEELERREGGPRGNSSLPPRGIHSDARYTSAASPPHLMALTRTSVVGAAVDPSWRLPSQAALNFTSPLRRAGRGGLSPPHGPTAPRGAPYPGAIAAGALHPEEPGPMPARLMRAAPDQPCSRITRSTRLWFTARPSRRLTQAVTIR